MRPKVFLEFWHIIKKKSGFIEILFSIPGIKISSPNFNSKIGVIAFMHSSEEILNSSPIKTFPCLIDFVKVPSLKINFSSFKDDIP